MLTALFLRRSYIRAIASFMMLVYLFSIEEFQVLASEIAVTVNSKEEEVQTPVTALTSKKQEAQAPSAWPVTNPIAVAQASKAPPLTFSASPTTSEIIRHRIFPEPLLPMGTSVPEAGELAALAKAIDVFEQASVDHSDISAIEGFLRQYPQTAFKVALLTNLGIYYRQNGLWSRALASWREAWTTGKGETDPTKKLIVDRALAQLAELTARIGRVDELKAILADAGNRDVRGAAAERYIQAKASLSMMESVPTKSFRCGPLAVGQISKSLHPSEPMKEEVHDSVSTDHGTSLTMVRDFANKLGLKYQVAYRKPGSAVIVPSVINWKLGHYAAIVEEVNGKYLVRDSTFTDHFVVSSTAIDQEGSGYFLVRAGALPQGWRTVPDAEAQGVWGKGAEAEMYPAPPPEVSHDPCINSGISSDEGEGMPIYYMQLSVVNLILEDTPIFYDLPRGPKMAFKANYSQRDVAPSNVPFYSNLGSQWNCNWVSFITDDPNNRSTSSYGPGGGTLKYQNYTSTSASTGSFVPQDLTQATLRRTSATSYVKVFTDGSKQIFNLSDNSSPNSHIFMTESDDPAGNKTTYNYDPVSFRLLSVTDALGGQLTLSYLSEDTTSSDYYRISKVSDGFGRSASFGYNGNGQLSGITDMAGISSHFEYGTGDALISLLTPYGTTTFQATDTGSDRSLLVTDPQGAQEKAIYKFDSPPPDQGAAVPSAPGLLTSSSYQNYRTTYYWNKKAYAQSPDDYSKAHLYHWLHTIDGSSASYLLESEKLALESRVYYNYVNQTSAIVASNSGLRTKMARVLDDGSTQLYQYDYNPQGNLKKVTSPGDAKTPARSTTYHYDPSNGIDLLYVYQENPNGTSTDDYGVKSDLIQAMTYDPQGRHLVISSTDAAGQTSYYSYNAYGQILTSTNPKTETTTYVYDRNQEGGGSGITDGYLVSITRPSNGATTIFGYDQFNRLSTVKDSEGYIITTGYDAIGGDPTKTLNRVATHTYPDHTYEQVDYDRLDPGWTRDRLGRWTQLLHDALRHVTVKIDPLNRVTQYNWCSCGALESIVDPNGNRTTWMRDVQSRITGKLYADNSMWHRVYETNTSRVKQTSDANGQYTNYTYNIDDSVSLVTFTDGNNNPLNPPTPSVTYSYDSAYKRLSGMQDGIGTTTYSYNPVATLGAGKLMSVTGPYANSVVTYGYDQLGRVNSRAITGGNNSSCDYDSLGRVQSVTNVLGNFTYGYLNNTARLSNVTFPNGQGEQYDYFDGNSDPLLKSTNNSLGGGTASRFEYSYSAVGDVLSWKQANSGQDHPVIYGFGYDADSELTSATLQDTVSKSILDSLAYAYDAAGNRISKQGGGSVVTESPNSLNQLVETRGGGLMRFAGVVSTSVAGAITVTVGGNPATVHTDNSFEGWAPVSGSGTTNVPIVARDSAGNQTNKVASVSPAAVATQKFGYDKNGNMTSAGAVNYGWDAANRLVSITQGSNVTRFDYDGQGRRRREIFNGVEIKRWIWIGSVLAEERDSSNNVKKRFFPQGEQISEQNYYYTRDHLGSVRELIDGSQAVRARYNYDPHGVRSNNLVTNNPVEADFGFTGYYFHPSSGLHLSRYRAYNSSASRWLSRDPLENAEILQNPNLYVYCFNNPTTYKDADGRFIIVPILLGIGLGLAIIVIVCDIFHPGHVIREQEEYPDDAGENPIW